MGKLLVRIEYGIFVGCFAFVLALFYASTVSGGVDAIISQGLIKCAKIFIIIGIGYSVPCLIYEREDIAMNLKILFQLALGGIVNVSVLYSAGVVHRRGLVRYILMLLGSSAVAWVYIKVCQWLLVKKINRKIKEKNRM